MSTEKLHKTLLYKKAAYKMLVHTFSHCGVLYLRGSYVSMETNVSTSKMQHNAANAYANGISKSSFQDRYLDLKLNSSFDIKLLNFTTQQSSDFVLRRN